MLLALIATSCAEPYYDPVNTIAVSIPDSLPADGVSNKRIAINQSDALSVPITYKVRISAGKLALEDNKKDSLVAVVIPAGLKTGYFYIYSSRIPTGKVMLSIENQWADANKQKLTFDSLAFTAVQPDQLSVEQIPDSLKYLQSGTVAFRVSKSTGLNFSDNTKVALSATSADTLLVIDYDKAAFTVNNVASFKIRSLTGKSGIVKLQAKTDAATSKPIYLKLTK